MKTHRTCGECRNSKLYDEQDFPLLCKKTGIAVYVEDCCEDFVPKVIKTCGECRNSEPFSQTSLLCAKNESGIEVNFDYCCEDFVPENSVANKLEAAAKKCAMTGDRKDLQAYLRLRREML